MVGDDARFRQRFAPVAKLPSPRTKLVYLYLHVADGATVEELHESLGIQYLELYSALRVLRERDIVRSERSIYRCRVLDGENRSPLDGRFSRM